MKKIFITGEDGAIALAIKKLATDFDIKIVNNEVEYLATYNNNKEIDFVFNPLNFKLAIKQVQPDIIIHAGAYVGTDYCLNADYEAIRTNVHGTQKVVDMCHEFNIKLIYLSTTAIFDPKDYSQDKQITEKTNINPQTLYGITKYAGELIVKNLCKNDKLILRPVFGFGDYPNDLHSALTKLCYHIIKKPINELKILLDKDIAKNYYRVENIASIILQLIQKEIWNESINIGENWTKRKDWYNILGTIHNYISPNLDNVMFYPDLDYLGWHNIDNKKMLNLIGKVKNEISFDKGLEMTINSIKQYE